MIKLEILNKNTFYKIKIEFIAEKFIQYHDFRGLTKTERKVYIILKCHNKHYMIFFTQYKEIDKYIKSNISEILNIDNIKNRIKESEFIIYTPKEKEYVIHTNTFENKFGHYLVSKYFVYDYQNNLIKKFNLVQ